MCVNSDVGYSNLPITFRVLISLSFNEMSECRVGLVVFVQDKFDMASEEPSIFEFGSKWKKKKSSLLRLNYDCLDLLWNGIIWTLKEDIPFNSTSPSLPKIFHAFFCH
jgi:hypothetical protein